MSGPIRTRMSQFSDADRLRDRAAGIDGPGDSQLTSHSSRRIRSVRNILSISVALCLASIEVPRARAAEISADRLLAADRVAEVSIEIPADDWKELCRQTRDPGKAFSGNAENPFTWFQGDITIDGETIRSVGIRKKGFIGSLDNQWPSLKVKFDEYVEQSPIPGLEGLTLNNNKQDP